jgi:hypothetical protein
MGNLIGPTRRPCDWCGKLTWFGRKDARWCSNRCRYQWRQENAKFDVPLIPCSGFNGITFNRIRKHWQVTIPEGKRRKYIGSFKHLPDAVAFQREVLSASYDGVVRGHSQSSIPLSNTGDIHG